MMQDGQREQLLQEAKMQAEALKRLGVWRRAALSLTVIGMLVIYMGFVTDFNILRGVFGILLTVIAGSAAFLISLGRRNGKKNVESILKAVDDL